MGKTSQRKRSAFELGVEHAKKTGRGWLVPRAGGPIAAAYINGVKAGLSKLTPTYSPDYADGCDYGAIAFESDINEGLWTWLKRLALVAGIALLALRLTACSTRSIVITPGTINATSTTLLYCPEASVTRVVDGNRTVDTSGVETGVGETLKGVADAIFGGAK